MKTKRPILLRWPQRLVRAAAWAVLLTFSANIVTPTLVNARDAGRLAEFAAPKRTEFEEVNDTLVLLEDALDRMNRRLQGRWEFAWQEVVNRGGQTPPGAAPDRAAVRALEDELDAAVPRLESLQGTVRSYFAQVRRQLLDSDLDPAILARHDDSVDEYEANYTRLKAALQAIKTARTLEEFRDAVASGDAFLKSHSSKTRRSQFDPDAPRAFAPGQSRGGKAFVDAESIRKARGLGEPGAASKARAADPKAAPIAPELAATQDAQLTPAVRAKAEALGNNPVEIYGFVRNNVEFVPTYGSIQGADQTLKTLRGNAFDQASLLVALLRAANVPARYVYGTIELPIEKVQNWVGTPGSADAAFDLLSVGGIPAIGVTQGGVFKRARIEHVWVEAFVDFVPSRGARQVAGDTWVPLDPSYKLHSFVEPVAVRDPQSDALLQAFSSASADSETNAAEGYTRSTNAAQLQSTIAAHQAALVADLSTTMQDEDPSAFVRSRAILTRHASVLATTMEAKVLAVASKFEAIPDSMRWFATIEVKHIPLGTTSSTAPVMFSKTLPFADVSAENVALRYTPASEADGHALVTGVEGAGDRISASTVRVVPELTVGEDIVVRGAAVGIGSQMEVAIGLRGPNTTPREGSTAHAAGTYSALSFFAGTRDAGRYEQMGEETKRIIAQYAAGNISEMDRHNTIGYFLGAVADNFWMLGDYMARVSANRHSSEFLRLPSFGVFSWHTAATYYFGLPRTVTAGGFGADVDSTAIALVKLDGSGLAERALIDAIGSQSSYLEGASFALIKQTALSNPGTSTTSLLAKAFLQGQRIYTLNSSTLSSLGSINAPADVKNDIANALNAGLEVTMPQNPVDMGSGLDYGWRAVDPATGAGFYMIDVGTAGGDYNCQCFDMSLDMELLWAVGGAVLGKLAGAAVGVVIAEFLIAMLGLMFTLCQIDRGNICETDKANARFIAYLATAVGLALTLLLVPGLGFAIFMAVVMMFVMAIVTNILIDGLEKKRETDPDFCLSDGDPET